MQLTNSTFYTSNFFLNASNMLLLLKPVNMM